MYQVFVIHSFFDKFFHLRLKGGLMSFDFSFFSIIIQVIFLEGILSIDNAAVLGAMVSVLPAKEKIPWPAPLKFLGAPAHRLLGSQRSAALRVGLLGAYIGRGLMLVMASFVIRNAFLKFLGAAYLIKLAFENLGSPETDSDAEAAAKSVEGKSFWATVLAVELADLAFSLDNAVAVVALSSNLYIVMLGVAIGIFTMRFAAGIFAYLITKEPILKPAAYLLVLSIGFQLLLDEFLGLKIGGSMKLVISAGIMILTVVYSRVKCLHFLERHFQWLGGCMFKANAVLEWLFIPVIWGLKTIRTMARRLKK